MQSTIEQRPNEMLERARLHRTVRRMYVAYMILAVPLLIEALLCVGGGLEIWIRFGLRWTSPEDRELFEILAATAWIVLAYGTTFFLARRMNAAGRVSLPFGIHVPGVLGLLAVAVSESRSEGIFFAVFYLLPLLVLLAVGLIFSRRLAVKSAGSEGKAQLG